MRIALMAIGALALAGCMPSAQMQASEQARASDDLADALAGRIAGKPQDCISTSGTDGPQIIDNRTVLYRAGRRTYRNDLPAECRGLRPLETLIVELHGSQICRNDQFRVVAAGSRIPGPYCRFGQFVPYTKD